jgi:hypothetical protein
MPASPPRPVPHHRRNAAGSVAALLVVASALAGCSGGTRTSSSAGSSDGSRVAGGAVAGGDAKRAAAARGSVPDAAVAQDTSARVLPVDRSVVYRGEVTVRVRDVAAALDRVESLVEGANGLVAAEQSSREPGRRDATTAQLTVKVPPTRFRATLDRVGRLGRELSRTQSAEDVTTQVVDVASRLRSQRRSVARVQALLDRATTIGAIVSIEGELARREADLESLEAQQATLDSLTGLATIEVSLVGPTAPPAPVAQSPLGFLNGLRDGWDAFAHLALVALTAVGAALPFLTVLALLGVPAWVLLRRRRAAPATAPSAPAS